MICETFNSKSVVAEVSPSTWIRQSLLLPEHSSAPLCLPGTCTGRGCGRSSLGRSLHHMPCRLMGEVSGAVLAANRILCTLPKTGPEYT